MYNLNHIIVIIFNCTRAYAWGYTLIKLKKKILIWNAKTVASNKQLNTNNNIHQPKKETNKGKRKEEKRKQLDNQICQITQFQEKNTLTKLFSYVAHFLEFGFQLKLEFQASLGSFAWRAMRAAWNSSLTNSSSNWNLFQKCAI